MPLFRDPQEAYKSGYALQDELGGPDTFRHVTEQGVGTRYTVPNGAVVVELVLESAGHGPIYGAPLSEVLNVATETRPM